MASSSLVHMASSSEYMICRPEKLRISDIFSVLLFRRRPVSSKLVESSSSRDQESNQESLDANLITLITWTLQRILLWFSGPLALFGITVEFTLNLVEINGGILRLFRHVITGSLVIPDPESADFRSFIGHVDGRTDLYRISSSSSSVVPKIEGITNDINPLDLCMMASKVAYENSAYVHNVVTNHWKMRMVAFYNFWNKFLNDKTTQAFIFSDRPENAQLIVVAFRGTELFNAKDWSTDVDLSWLSMGEMGKVHVGFMKALGLQDDVNYEDGWPKDYTEGEEVAYYTIRDKLKTLLQENKDARILVTGHSLGGALALLFPSILVLHREDTLLSRLSGVFTFGQPRVGDKEFGRVMKAELNATFKRYYRVVFRYDIITRIPFTDPITSFSHFGGCIYYWSWYEGKVMREEPDRNYFNPLYIPSEHLNAWWDLFRAVFVGKIEGKDFKESSSSIVVRVFGLIIPGIASHSLRDYINSARLGTIIPSEDEEIF